MSTSVVRAMRILELLSESEKPLPLSRITEDLEIPRSTAYKILRDLADRDFVALGEPSVYSIGLKAFEVGSAHLRTSGVAGLVAPHLARLTQSMGMTSHYAILDGADAVYLCKEDPPGLGVQLASSVGVRLPAAVTAVGKSCLAWLPPERVSAHLGTDREGDRPLSREELARELESVREQGYSTDDGDTASGIRCVAAPIFDLAGPLGAIGVSYLIGSATDTAAVADEVCGAARDVTALLGGKVTR